MRSRNPRDFCGICPQCFLKVAMCICAELPHMTSNTEIVIVRHVAEEWLTSNTGRLAALMLTNSRIVSYGGGEPFDDATIRGDVGTWLLYPGPVSYTHLRAHETDSYLVCSLLLEK